MATISMAMSIPKRPTNSSRFTFDIKYPSNKLCFSTTATGLTRSYPTFQLKALQTCDDQIITNERRSGNYPPPVWDFDFIQSLRSEYKDEIYLRRAHEMKVKVEMLLDEEIDYIRRMELVDDLQRLGISYHFDDKIKQILNHIYDDHGNKYCDPTNLYSTALRFRLFRQHGFSVSQDVFDCFKNEHGQFKESLGDDTKGLLQLYEASFMQTKGEKTLDLAREFAVRFLLEKIDDDHEELSLLVGNALQFPIHWRSQRPNSKPFIHAYERRRDMNPIVLELAKLDFNIVQATHQQELKHVSRWWEQTCLAKKLPFARDRLISCYFWSVGGLFEPQYGHLRIIGTKVNALITIIDDMFDVYGTFEELQLFTDTIKRWDIEAMDKLPDYMQICFLALNNFVNEMAYDVLKEQGFLIIPHLRKSWADICQAGLQEAEWYSKGYTPKLEEYLSNAWVSVSGPVILSHAFFILTNPIQKENVQSLYKYHNIVRCSSTIVRLANDLGSTPEEKNRGDVSKSIQCYMNESGASEEEAREHVKVMIHEMWKEMNEEQRVVAADLTFQPEFVRSAFDLGRIAQHIYQHGDGRGIHFLQIKDCISSLLFEPIV